MSREPMSVRLGRLVAEAKQNEQTLAVLRRTAQQILASSNDHSDQAVMARELAAFALARDVLALVGDGEPSVLRVVRGGEER